MAETTRFLPDQQLDLGQILKEAAHRWLRPAEICEILHNYQRFQITPDPPNRPPAGSLFLVDRKALRYFRKDGHRWRKKKDGKTVKEAHEKLKSGSVDVLHCYYAHGEENQNFQRRSYWMLDQQLQHIVLVHYRDVKEEYNSGISLLPSQGSQVGSPLSSSTPSSAQTCSPVTTLQTSFTSNPNRSYWNGQTTSSAVEDVDSGGNLGDSFLTQPGFVSLSSNASLPSKKIAESSRNPLGSWYTEQKFYPGAADSSVWNGIHSSIKNADSMFDKKCYVDQASGADIFTHKLTHDRLIPDIDIQAVATVSKIDTQVQPIVATEMSSKPQIVGTFDELVKNQNKIKVEDVAPSNEESGGLKKLDSFGRWMDEEIGVHCDDSLMASDSASFWNTLDAEKDDKEVSSLSRHMQLDVESLGPSLSQEQLFSICDFSPDWAYSDDDRKVLIAGRFLGSKKHSDDSKWGCMFGEIEVSAEVLTDNVIRCRTPSHAPGRVPFYVTCCNRLACSEVRDFEFRQKPLGIAITPKEEVRFQIRLGKLLNLGPERKYLDCSVVDCEKCKVKSIIQSMMSRIDGMLPSDILMKCLLKDKVFEWLVCKIHEEGKGPHVLDDEGFGVIHLTAALGYDWALGPIVTAGTNPNFRDAHGRTGLHWASYFGREETVAALVKLGAAPGAVDDPTPILPGGQTASDLASSRGHKGIAACLAKADLTDHLVILETNEELTDSLAERIAAESAAEAEVEVVTSDLTVDNRLLKGSLAAVRKSAQAAALIQAAFRNRSFRERQLAKLSDDDPDVSLDLVALASSSNKVPRGGDYEDYLHSAAARIQKKYRGWKGRREFLKIRDRVVRLQARVRGNQVRKQYKKVVWSVSMLEKVILRWRRKGAGLRGFQVEKAVEDASSEVGKSDEYEYEFLRAGRRQKCVAVEKALTSVKEMVRYPEAREQYMRIVAKLGKLEMGDEGNIASQPVENQQKKSGLEEELDEFIRNH